MIRSALAGWLCCCALAGCYAHGYEQRLENTRKLYARMELLDANLGRYWADETGVQLRPPIQFSPLAAASQGDAGNPNAPDLRQPNYMSNFELPGLRGAFFSKPLRFHGSEGAAGGEEHGYLYVLTNHHLRNSDKFGSFATDFVRDLSSVLHAGVKPDDWRDEKFPSQVGALAQVVPYKSLVINPNETLGGFERRFSLYLHEAAGGTQVIVMFVVPKGLDGSDKLDALRIPLCLETLRVGNAAPAASSGGTTSAGTSPPPRQGPSF